MEIGIVMTGLIVAEGLGIVFMRWVRFELEKRER